MTREISRVAWMVAGRGDALLLGPAFMELRRVQNRPGAASLHWMLDTGENGMAMHQARDLVGLKPDETGELCHPADEPAIRLALILERVESFVRRHKAGNLIFSGFGQTAAASALYCHARGCRGLWVRPPDPAGVVGRLRWEAGLERIIRSLSVPALAGIPPEGGTPKPVSGVQVWQVPAMPRMPVPPVPDLTLELPGLRPDAPRALIAVLRREWGYMDDATERLARAAGAWAAARPDADILVISNLNARIEGPMRSIAGRAANLILAPPLPWPVYAAALARARVVLTDSPMIAAEAMAHGVPVATLGDLAVEKKNAPLAVAELVPSDLNSEELAWLIYQLLDRTEAGATVALPADINLEIRSAIDRFLDQAP